ncbi:STAS domain-containing protein [Streptomyces sp. NBC_00878]|uniref:STAS domain-containing protein n=1 Tax=Streptomyces sp. NBC_00878 TaxID=2975854 RepID=UPI0022561C81|nr:STAS domain-containing protein [Streptomyces sp. NBC_00878]MCX4903134.1 STAS domain-containing protein [Streptomyces sp. NBC_00878]
MSPEFHDQAPGLPERGTAEPGVPTANPYAHSYPSGGFTVVEVRGEIDMATADALTEHLDAATSAPAPRVLVDLRRVAFIDCSGLRVLCRADRRAKERGGSLRLVSDQPRIHRLLRASGLLNRFPPLPTLPSPSLPPPSRPESEPPSFAPR